MTKGARDLIAAGVIYPSVFQAGKNATIFQALGAVVKNAMAPFETGCVTLSISYADEVKWGETTLHVGLECLREQPPFRFKFDRRLLDLAHEPEEVIFASIAEDLFKYFRFRPSLPIEEHIVLGED